MTEYIKVSEINYDSHQVFLKNNADLYILKKEPTMDMEHFEFKHILNNTNCFPTSFHLEQGDMNIFIREYCLDILYNNEVEIHIFPIKTKDLYKFVRDYFVSLIKNIE